MDPHRDESAATRERAPRAFVAKRVRRNPWLMSLAAVPLVLPVLGAVLINPNVLAGLLHASVFSALAARYLWGKNYWARRAPTKVRIDGDALVLGHERITRDDMEAGFVIESLRGPVLRLERRGLAPALELVLDEPEDGRLALLALGLDPSQSVTSFRGMSLAAGSFSRTFAMLGALAALGTIVGSAIALLSAPAGVATGVVTAIIGMIVGSLWPTTVRVGADGVLVKWLTYQRFVPHDDILAVRVEERGFGNSKHTAVVLTLENGPEIALPIERGALSDNEAPRVAQRIDEAKAIHDRGGADFDAHVLARHHESTEDWVRMLRGLTRLATHRTSMVRATDLWKIVESHGAAPLARAAAAVALEPELGEPDRTRLRVAAATTAQPRLRVALDRVADGAADEAILEALAELETEAGERSSDVATR